MDYFSLSGLMDLCQALSVDVAAAKDANNFILVLFAIIYVTTNKGCYFAAFILDLFLSNSIMLNSLTESQYYLLPMFIYSLLYWHVNNKKIKIETALSIGLLIIFNLWMSFDAIINKQNESFVYNNHTSITVFVYVLLFISLFPWQRIRNSMDDFTRTIIDIIRYSDVVAYICYNCEKKPT